VAFDVDEQVGEGCIAVCRAGGRVEALEERLLVGK
jgi:hypothetical protein